MAADSRWVYQKGTLWALELVGEETQASQIPEPVLPRIEAALEETYDANPVAAAMGMSDSDQAQRRFSTGRRCFVARVDGAIAAYGWASVGAECVGEMEREFRLQPGEAYIWDCATLPLYRRQRLYSALLSHINATLFREGFRRIWIGSDLDNQPSILGFANAGFLPVAHITYLRLLRLCFLKISGHHDVPNHMVTALLDAMTSKDDRQLGRLVFGRANTADLTTCAELEA